jgi:hypothetical protein
MIARRTIIGAAATAVVASPIISVADTDPILNIIDRHRAALAELTAASIATDEVKASNEGREVAPDAYDRLEVATDADFELRELLASTAPTTMAGLAAAISWLMEYDEGCLPETSGRFLRTLAKSGFLNI